MRIPSVAFFFGSGISYASKAPTVGKISTALFDQSWTRHSTGIFIPADSRSDPAGVDLGHRAQSMLRSIKGELDAHLLKREGRESHYEDLYSAALQIFQDEASEITNSLIARSIEALRLATAQLHVGGDRNAFDDPFVTLVGRSMDLIRSVVWQELAQAVEPKELGSVSEVASQVDEVDIFTLNHDLLVEKQLASAGIGFADGFGDRRSGYRIFNGFWPPGRGVRILKLHGSLNWYFCRFKRFDQYAAFDLPLEKCYDEDGTRVDDLNPIPQFLTGTTVKEQRYGHSVFGEIFAQFRRLTSGYRRIVCSGYGWGDKGINIRLDQWLHDQPDNRLVILHGGSLEDMLRSRFWWRRWESYSTSRKVVVFPKWLSGCSASEIEELLTEK